MASMDVNQVHSLLDNGEQARQWLQKLGLEKPEIGYTNLVSLAKSGITPDLLGVIFDQLASRLADSSDPDMALNNLSRFAAASRNPLALGSLFERDTESLKILLQIFATSQHFSDLLVFDPESFDLLRITEGQPVARATLIDEIWSELEALEQINLVGDALRRFKRRETLRIAYGDLIREQRLETVTQQISYLADAIVEGAIRFSRRKHESERGVPRGPSGQRSQFAVLGMGKLGGMELNYSSDIDLICIYDHDGKTDGSRPQSNSEFFAAVVRDMVKLLAENTELGMTYRVDLRLRPNGSQAPLVISIEAARQYYDLVGRTWERQAFVKARTAAGDISLGDNFLVQINSWVYRRYLSLADITGIKALKRRIEHRTRTAGEEEYDVKTGRGGIRDIEFVIQFLQLLNGGDLPAARTANTLEAIDNLENEGCLSDQERSLLSENYRFLRKLEHRLQIMFDLQTHQMPRDEGELRKLAIRMGYSGNGQTGPRKLFENDYEKITAENRKVLDHLLHDAFGDDAPADREVDLVLDPNPTADYVQQVLGRYGFKDTDRAYRNLMELSRESIRFLSTRRCRHFLASIASRLLMAISQRPDPDSTLLNLCKVSDSLGGKGALWELFSFNPPTLKLYVDLCATSPYLSSILISNPGMIDGLMDSLVLDKLPELRHLESMLADLCRSAEDTEPILHSFKNAQQLRVGVRDILGKEDIDTTTGALSHIAEAILRQVTRIEYPNLASRLGEPVIAMGPRAGHISEFVILAMGKFGGRELNYRSDLDIVFLYEDEGGTQHRRPKRKSQEMTSNRHFFGELGQRIIKIANHLGPYGRLYEIDPRLRPTGRSGPLATSLPEFSRYFSEGDGQLWERMALCRARVVLGNEIIRATTLQVIAESAYGHPWQQGDADEIVQMRHRLEESASKGNLKRGAGGIVDIEFITQMLQLRHGHDLPSVRQSNTLSALISLHNESLLSDKDFEYLISSYRLLRTIESRLRLMNSSTSNDLPDDKDEFAKLALTLGYAEPSALSADCEKYTQRNRELFHRFFEEAAASA